MQLFWPDFEPRKLFHRRVRSWDPPKCEELDVLCQGLDLATQIHSLPFLRRTLLEFILPGDEALGWWETLRDVCRQYGWLCKPMTSGEILRLARWTMNMRL
jgi:hypothetical protein